LARAGGRFTKKKNHLLGPWAIKPGRISPGQPGRGDERGMEPRGRAPKKNSTGAGDSGGGRGGRFGFFGSGGGQSSTEKKTVPGGGPVFPEGLVVFLVVPGGRRPGGVPEKRGPDPSYFVPTVRGRAFQTITQRGWLGGELLQRQVSPRKRGHGGSPAHSGKRDDFSWDRPNFRGDGRGSEGERRDMGFREGHTNLPGPGRGGGKKLFMAFAHAFFSPPPGGGPGGTLGD